MGGRNLVQRQASKLTTSAIETSPPRQGERHTKQIAMRLSDKYNTKLEANTIDLTVKSLEIEGTERTELAVAGTYFSHGQQVLIEEHLAAAGQIKIAA